MSMMKHNQILPLVLNTALRLYVLGAHADIDLPVIVVVQLVAGEKNKDHTAYHGDPAHTLLHSRQLCLVKLQEGTSEHG